MIIWSSINCPIVICLPIVCYFSREKTLLKSTAPGSILYHICFEIYFYSLLFSDLLIQKPKIPWCNFLFIYFISCFREIFLSNVLQIYLSFYPGGIDNPSYMLDCDVYYATFLLVDVVGPPSAEFCRTVANFPQVVDLRFINPWRRGMKMVSLKQPCNQVTKSLLCPQHTQYNGKLYRCTSSAKWWWYKCNMDGR